MAANALVSIVLPVFALILLGYAVARIGLLPLSVGDSLSDFAVTIAIPALLFRSIGTFSPPDFSPWVYWATYFTGVMVVWMSATLLATQLFHRGSRQGVLAGVSGGYANMLLLGLPIVDMAFGHEGTTLIFLLMSVHLPLLTSASVILIAVAEHREAASGAGIRASTVARRLVISLFTNPLILAVLAGSAFRLTGLPLEGLAASVIDRLGATVIPLALFSLGMSLTRYGIRGNLPLALTITFLKLLVMPGIVYVIGKYVAGLPPLAVAVSVIAAASPTGINAYLIANRFQTGVGLVSTVITLATIGGILSYTFWLTVLGI